MLNIRCLIGPAKASVKEGFVSVARPGDLFQESGMASAPKADRACRFVSSVRVVTSRPGRTIIRNAPECGALPETRSG